MLTIIEPKDHKTYQVHIDSFLSLLAFYQNYTPHPQDWNDGTFIIASDNEFGVYGGAILLKKSIWELEHKLRQIILTIHSDIKTVWTVKIGFHREHEARLPKIKILNGYLNFYQDLLKAFNDYGNRKGIDFLCLSLNAVEHLKLKKYGCWHYAGTISPDESLNKQFHSILVLSGRVK